MISEVDSDDDDLYIYDMMQENLEKTLTQLYDLTLICISFYNLQADSLDAIRNIVHAYVSARKQTVANSIFWRSNTAILSNIWRLLLQQQLLWLAPLRSSFLSPSNKKDTSNLARENM
jgi:hypothetical protein